MSHAQFCPELLYLGECRTSDCQLKHNAKFCSLCAHRAAFAATQSASASNWFTCSICNDAVSGESTWIQHLAGEPHKTKARQKGQKPHVLPVDSYSPNCYRCFTCKKNVQAGNWRSHLRSRVHSRLQNAARQRIEVEQAEQAKRGVTVSHAGLGVDFGIVSCPDAQRGVQLEVTVKSSSAATPRVSLVRAETLSKNGLETFPFSATIVGNARVLQSGQPIQVRVILKHGQRGRYHGRLEITLKDSAQRSFIIIRELKAVVGDPDHHELLKAVAPFVHRRPTRWRKGGLIIEGDPLPALGAVRWVKKLEQSLIPSDLNALLKQRSTQKVLDSIKDVYVPPLLSVETHERYFRALLWIEEFRLRHDLRMYDLADVQGIKEERLYTLNVPGLAEKRPSVVIGDTLLVQSAHGDGQTHKGHVHAVRLENIGVHFNSSFNPAKRYNVRFEYNRTTIKRQHQALMARSTSLQRLLFPSPQHVPLAEAMPYGQFPITLFNSNIASNEAQLQAVQSILWMRDGTAPFIVFGPPGTGKTVTIVEAILQILERDPNARILACAPSNSAADLIAQRLLALNPEELLRCNAFFRNRHDLPEELAPYSTLGDNHFPLPSIEKLASYRAIVSTCGHASFAYNLGMPHGHFTHIFIDEAGQGTEPEVLTAAIKTLASPSTRVILSGDPQQLGPVIRSSIARELGLGKSYLERLMELSLYQDPLTGRGRSYIKLVQNFRSHKAILNYPNEKFYSGELEVYGPVSSINSFLGSTQLPKPQFPIIFHAVSGENERESSSPSYFNIDEATEVLDYVQELLRDRRFPVRPQEIGVITPYYAQMKKIRTLLEHKQIEGIKVASVEAFQGQERRVIIISTVRSSRDLLSYDAKFTLGFVSNPRRFNVAITRAQALLIVIGDAYVLSIDPMWRGFMNYVHSHGGWKGDAPTWDTNAAVRADGDYATDMREAAAAEMDALIARLTEGEDLEGEANVDQAFQEVE